MKYRFLLGFQCMLMQLSALTWSTPETISNTIKYAAEPMAGIDSSGKAYVIWRLPYQNDGNIRFAYESLLSIWTLPVSLFSGEGYASQAPSIDYNASGNLIVTSLFEEFAYDYSAVKALKYTSGSWGTPVTIADGTMPNSNASAHLNSSSNALVCWNCNPGST